VDEQALVLKPVTKWHLSVPERRALPNRKARARLACKAIVEVLSEKGWFPVDWRSVQGYHGGLIERRPDGTYDIHRKTEARRDAFRVVLRRSLRRCSGRL
jgi:hypothetical protein